MDNGTKSALLKPRVLIATNQNEPLSVTAQELATRINKHVQEQLTAKGKPRSAANVQNSGSFSNAPTRRRGLPRLSGQQVMQLILIAIICVGILVYFIPRLKSNQSVLPPPTGPAAKSVPDDFFQHAYATKV